ncbi:MAG: cell division protein FtsZ [Alphaproteobacteria bacterium]|nr:cell division protein FtsZ [Alphaproteobacteria bacterium]
MSIKLAIPESNVMHLKPRISVIGVGGGGGNAVNNMIDQNLEGVDFIVANTDAQALTNSKASRRIQLGLETTQGLGAGARPEVGRAAAEEATAEIEKELEGANMVFITAGMGGGTGSGAAPVVARIAKSKGILTVGVVTKPFQFEGKKRMETANFAVEDFTNSVDSIIIIPNQNLFRVADKKTTLADAFIMADNVLYAGVRSITDLMLMPGLINLDFADIKSIMEDKGKAIMGTGEAEGENRAVKAAEQALSNPLLDDCSMHGAKGVLINITGGSDITLFEIDEAASRIKEEVDDDANIIFGSSFDESLAGKIRVSIVATGIGGGVCPAVKAPEKKTDVNYIEESFTPESENPEAQPLSVAAELETIEPLASLDESNEIENPVEKSHEDVFENDEPEDMEQEVLPEPIQEEVQPQIQAVAGDEQFTELKDFENSTILPEMPQAPSLFQTIISKNEDINLDTQMQEILSANTNTFTAKTSVVTEEEPELFPNHNPHPSVFAPRRTEEPEQLIVNKTPEYTPTLIERVTGISIAKRYRKKAEKEEAARAAAEQPHFDNEFEDDKLNLEIPSFLRRK